MPGMKPNEVDLANLTIDALFMCGIDLQHRRVFLTGALETDPENGDLPKPGQSTPEQVARGLLWLDKSKGDIELWINSPGGLISEMFGLYDVIRTLDNKVLTVGYGHVCSAAGLLLASGHSRYSTPNCFFMSHMGEGSASGDIWTQEQQVAIDRVMFERWAQLMAKHTRHTKKWWMEVHAGTKRELWLDAKGMLRHGIVDEIWPPDDEEE